MTTIAISTNYTRPPDDPWAWTLLFILMAGIVYLCYFSGTHGI